MFSLVRKRRSEKGFDYVQSTIVKNHKTDQFIYNPEISFVTNSEDFILDLNKFQQIFEVLNTNHLKHVLIIQLDWFLISICFLLRHALT